MRLWRTEFPGNACNRVGILWRPRMHECWRHGSRQRQLPGVLPVLGRTTASSLQPAWCSGRVRPVQRRLRGSGRGRRILEQTQTAGCSCGLTKMKVRYLVFAANMHRVVVVYSSLACHAPANVGCGVVHDHTGCERTARSWQWLQRARQEPFCSRPAASQWLTLRAEGKGASLSEGSEGVGVFKWPTSLCHCLCS